MNRPPRRRVTRRPEPLGVDLATPPPVPERGIARATALMRRGRLFRYAETGGPPTETAAWERELAEYLGCRYAIATNSCGSAIYLALHSLGVGPGDVVLLNAWTLAPVPGAVHHVGARAVLVETAPDLTVDLDDLERRAGEHPGSVLLLSHMRGHVADMTAVTEICRRHDLRLVEDCAHSLGAAWAGRATGTFGVAACLSTQAYKHLNSGEGGALLAGDDDLAARALLASGSYHLYDQHLSRPPVGVLDAHAPTVPNHSMRLTDLAAALLRPQLAELPQRVEHWNALYARVAAGLAGVDGFRLPVRPAEEQFVGSSLQFFLDGLDESQIRWFRGRAGELGVGVKWFGDPEPKGFTSRYPSWAYAARPSLPGTDRVLSRLCDLRLPLALDLAACDQLVAILAYAHRDATQHGAGQHGAGQHGAGQPGAGQRASGVESPAGRPS